MSFKLLFALIPASIAFTLVRWVQRFERPTPKKVA